MQKFDNDFKKNAMKLVIEEKIPTGRVIDRTFYHLFQREIYP